MADQEKGGRAACAENPGLDEGYIQHGVYDEGLFERCTLFACIDESGLGVARSLHSLSIRSIHVRVCSATCTHEAIVYSSQSLKSEADSTILSRFYNVSHPPLLTSPSNFLAIALHTLPFTISQASRSSLSYLI